MPLVVITFFCQTVSVDKTSSDRVSIHCSSAALSTTTVSHQLNMVDVRGLYNLRGGADLRADLQIYRPVLGLGLGLVLGLGSRLFFTADLPRIFDDYFDPIRLALVLGVKFEITKNHSIYDLRKYYFTKWIVTIWNSLPNSAQLCDNS